MAELRRTEVGIANCGVDARLNQTLAKNPDLAVEAHEVRKQIFIGGLTISGALDQMRLWGPITTSRQNPNQSDDAILVSELEHCFESIRNGKCQIYRN